MSKTELLKEQKSLEGQLHILYLTKVELSNELKELLEEENKSKLSNEKVERIKAVRLELKEAEDRAIEIDKKLCEIDKKTI